MRSALAAVVAVPMVVAATALPAHAAAPSVHAASTAKITTIPNKGYTCTGRLLQKKNLTVSGKTIGVLRVYTTTAGGVNVKACYYPTGTYAKASHYTAVQVYGYASRTAKKPAVVSLRRANTHKSIGPAGVKGLNTVGRCAVALAAVRNGSKVYSVTSQQFCYTVVYK